MAFDRLHPALREAIARLGYRRPTPIQEAGIPPVLEGKHVLLVAPTGYGKTEAALFPILSRILEEGASGVRALYITPLRALNRDLLSRVFRVCEAVGLRVAVRHSDSTAGERRGLAASPPHLLITTPESLQILLLHRRVRPHLRAVRHVVVDEVHELVSSKRGVQLALALERLVELAGEFQRVGLSATVGDVELVAAFLGGMGRRVEVVDVSGHKEMEATAVLPLPTEEDYAEAEELDATPETLARVRRVAEYIRGARGGVLVFTNTRDAAEFLASRLKRLVDGVEVHHSSLSREHREAVEERLRSGQLKAVVATSSLELGIDVGHVELVVQYGSPRQVTRLVQRVGRSGHRLGEASRGVIVAADFEDLLESEVIAERAAGRRLESEVEYHENALDVLAHQLVGMALEAALEGRQLEMEQVKRVVKRAHPYRDLADQDLGLVVDFLNRHRLLAGLRPRRGSIRYYFENVSTIPDEKSYRAVDASTGSKVGELDREFVFGLEPGARVVLSGRVWTFSRVEGDVVYLYPDYDVTGALPAWLGEQIPVPRDVAREVCRRRADALEAALRGDPGYGQYVDLSGLSPELVPRPGRPRVHIYGRYAVVHSCLGSKGNEALGLYLSHALSGYVGPVGYRADAYRVLLVFRDHVPAERIAEVLGRPIHFVHRTLSNAAKASRMYRYRFLQVARRLGILSKDAEDVPARLAEAYDDDLPGLEALRELFVEKLDVRALAEFMEEARAGVDFVRLREPTILERPILEEALRTDFAFRGLSREAVRDLARRRIANREAVLLCLNCGWTFRGRASSLPEAPRCARCGMRTLAVVKRVSPEQALAAWRKFRLGQRLARDEASLVEELRQSAALVLQHGKVGVYVQLAHGVGPRTAVQVLNRVMEGADLWDAIVDAERRFAATRAFWD